jgi:hypothetical protein
MSCCIRVADWVTSDPSKPALLARHPSISEAKLGSTVSAFTTSTPISQS